MPDVGGGVRREHEPEATCVARRRLATMAPDRGDGHHRQAGLLHSGRRDRRGLAKLDGPRHDAGDVVGPVVIEPYRPTPVRLLGAADPQLRRVVLLPGRGGLPQAVVWPHGGGQSASLPSGRAHGVHSVGLQVADAHKDAPAHEAVRAVLPEVGPLGA